MAWLTVKEAAKMLDCSEKTIRRKKDTGEFKIQYEPNLKGQSILKIFVSDGQNSVMDISEDSSVMDSDGQKTKLPNVVRHATFSDGHLKNKNKITEDTHGNILLEGNFSDGHDLETNTIKNIPVMDSDGQNLVVDISENPLIKIGDGHCLVMDSDGQKSQLILHENQEVNNLTWISKGELIKMSGVDARTIERWKSSGKITTKIENGYCLVAVETLPENLKNKYEVFLNDKKQIATSVLEIEKEEFASYDQELKNKAWAKLEIIKSYKEHIKDAKKNKVPLAEADNAFLKSLNTGKILEDAISKIGSTSIKSIKRWEKTWRDSGNAKYPVCFIEKKKSACGRKGYQEEAIINDIRMMCSAKQFNPINILRKINEFHPNNPYSDRTIRQYIYTFRSDNVIANIDGKESTRTKIKPHIWRINDAIPGFMWESDGKRFDLLVYSPYWWHRNKQYRLLVRPLFVPWIDVATGFITGWSVGCSETTILVRNALVEAVAQHGLPNRLRTDNSGAYKNYQTRPDLYAEKDTPGGRVAREMLKNNDKGLYYNLGIEFHSLTTPGNAEGKTIEAFFGYAISRFEREQFMYVGSNSLERQEHMKYTNKKLIDKYGDKILLWTEFVATVQDYVDEWNNTPRDFLRNGRGEKVSPKQAYLEFSDSMPKMSKELIESKSFYPALTTIQRDGIIINGLLYRHPYCYGRVGEKVKVFYNDKNLYDIEVYSTYGEKWAGKGQLVIPGSYIDQEQTREAIIDRARYEKFCKEMYMLIRTKKAKTIPEINMLICESLNITPEEQDRKQIIDKAIGLIPNYNKITTKASSTDIKLPEAEGNQILKLIKQNQDNNISEEPSRIDYLAKVKEQQKEESIEAPKINLDEFLKSRLGR